MHSGGLAWKRQGGGKTIEIDKADVTSVTWMKVPRAYQLGVRIKDGLSYRFIGFREQFFQYSFCRPSSTSRRARRLARSSAPGRRSCRRRPLSMVVVPPPLRLHPPMDLASPVINKGQHENSTAKMDLLSF